MGLDAVVYEGKTRQVQRKGGQEYVEGNTSSVDSQEVTAIHKRLGNASMIASVADEIRPFIEKDSLLLSKVLYSGSHSGDKIGVEDIDKLESEINDTRAKSGGSLSLAVENFFEDMSDLVEKAREEGSPIVFI